MTINKNIKFKQRLELNKIIEFKHILLYNTSKGVINMSRLNWIRLLNDIKTRLKMIQLSYKIMSSNLSVDEIIPLIDTLTTQEKIILLFLAPTPAVEFRIKVANQRLVSKRRENLHLSFKEGRIKEYLMSLPHWSLMIELLSQHSDKKSDEECQINEIIRHTVNESIYLSDPIVSKIIEEIQKHTLSINQVARQINYLGTYEMIAIYDADNHQDVLDQKVIEVLVQACNLANNNAVKRLSYKKR